MTTNEIKTDDVPSLTSYLENFQKIPPKQRPRMLKVNTDTGELCPCCVPMEGEDKMEYIAVDVEIKNGNSESVLYVSDCYFDVEFKERSAPRSFQANDLFSNYSSPDLIESIAGAIGVIECKDKKMHEKIGNLSDKVRKFYGCEK